MVRAAFIDKKGVRRGAWSTEEDDKLRAYVEKHGHGNWRQLPKFAGLLRCGKSCRLRWVNYLSPYVKRGSFTKEEENLIIKLHGKYGNKWSLISANLHGRTDNEIKNYWHTHLKKRIDLTEQSSKGITEQTSKGSKTTNLATNCDLSPKILESTPTLSLEKASSSECLSNMQYSKVVEDLDSIGLETLFEYTQNEDYFWHQPFLLDNEYIQNDYPLCLVDGEFTFYDNFVGDLFYHGIQ